MLFKPVFRPTCFLSVLFPALLEPGSRLFGVTPNLLYVVIGIVTVAYGKLRAFWVGMAYGILMQIMLPLVKPTIASLVIMNFVSCWNDYFNPLVFLPSKKWYTVSLGIQYYYTQEVPSTNLTMAMSVCAILPVLILFFSCQRFFIESITSSGVKG